MTTFVPFPLNSQQNLLLAGPSGQLDVLTTYPTSPHSPPVVAVICHPHPLLGGTLSNKVVTTLARSFNAVGFSTVRFNFRGVGKSQGEYAQGIGETEDLLALLQWLTLSCPNHQVWLAGFSFGAYVAARAAKQWPVAHLICVAPPVENFPFKTLPPFSCPWLIIHGDQDEIVSINAVSTWAQHLDTPPPMININGATHLFHGKLIVLYNQLLTYITHKLNLT